MNPLSRYYVAVGGLPSRSARRSWALMTKAALEELISSQPATAMGIPDFGLMLNDANVGSASS